MVSATESLTLKGKMKGDDKKKIYFIYLLLFIYDKFAKEGHAILILSGLCDGIAAYTTFV